MPTPKNETPASLVKKINKVASGRLDIQEFLLQIVGKFGGVGGFVNTVHEDFIALDPGHHLRVKLEESLLKLIAQTGTSISEIAAMPDEELDAQVRSLLKEECDDTTPEYGELE